MHWRVDAAAAAALVGLSQVEVWWHGAGGTHVVAAPTQAATGAAVGLRGRVPLVGVVVAVAATTADAVAGGTSVSVTAIVAWLVLFATAGASASGAVRYGSLGVGVVGSAAMSIGNSVNSFLAASLSSVALPWLVGFVYRRHRDARAHEERARRLEAEHEAAAANERARLARELHDIVSHNVGMIAVQATAGDVVFDDDPEQARAALRAIENGARDALAELRRLLGLLRDGDRAAVVAPQPTLAELAELIERVRATGIDVELDVYGTPRPIDAALELSVYRVVQEALTNIVRHANATQAWATVRWLPDRLEVEVADNGGGCASPTSGGHGLVGIGERVSLLGGVLETGPAAAGGFSVRARFPLGAAA
jgi:signal transduction histidine kinase